MKKHQYIIVFAESVKNNKPIPVENFIYDGKTNQVFDTIEEARLARYLHQKSDDNHYYKIVEVDD